MLETLYGPPAKLCPNCEKPVTVKGSTFCGVSCANASRKRPATNGRVCKICQKPLHGRQENACSRAHSGSQPFVAVHETSAPDAAVKTASTADHMINIEAVKRLRYAGKTRPEIAKELGVSKHTVQRIINAHQIPLTLARRTIASEGPSIARVAIRPPSAASNIDNIEAVKRLRAAGKYRPEIAAELGLSKHTVQKIIQQNDIPRPDVPRVSDRPPARPAAKRRPITIPLREVIRWASDLGCRRDIDAVSRAMRRADPSHPGFVLGESPRGMSWSRKE